MGKLVSSLIVTLDGFAGGPNGEIDMFNVDQEFFDLSGKLTEQAGTALYGRRTYELMNSYWPTAADGPGASKHDIEHSAWYNRVDKYVMSNTLETGFGPKTKIINGAVAEQINALKKEKEKDIQIFGSPGAVRFLMNENLIDEYWFFTAPVVLGKGLPFFISGLQRLNLKLLSSKALSSGIIAAHYQRAV